MHASVDLHVPTLLAAVLTAGAERFMVAHNHPTGDPSPTHADLVFTLRVREAADVVGLFFEDHLIVTPRKSRYVSLVDAHEYIPPVYTGAEMSA